MRVHVQKFWLGVGALCVTLNLLTMIFAAQDLVAYAACTVGTCCGFLAMTGAFLGLCDSKRPSTYIYCSRLADVERAITRRNGRDPERDVDTERT